MIKELKFIYKLRYFYSLLQYIGSVPDGVSSSLEKILYHRYDGH